ncbi:hypothetical protein ACG1VR_00195 (plasmid) [Cedecea davisae]|uniref:hypothetical protein n=1 Tax=Enterobacteriaceae TaxID=543 RepID=UPI00300C45F2
MEARQGGDGLPAPFTTAPVPVREVAHRQTQQEENRQDSDISQYAIGMATIGNDNAEIINRTGISPTGYNTSILIL